MAKHTSRLLRSEQLGASAYMLLGPGGGGGTQSQYDIIREQKSKGEG